MHVILFRHPSLGKVYRVYVTNGLANTVGETMCPFYLMQNENLCVICI